MNKLDLRKIIIILLLIIAVFGLIFFSEWISFEALKENRAEIAEFRDKNFTLSIISFWIFYVTLVVFSLPGAAVASVSGGFLFGLGGMGLHNLGPVDVSGGYWYPAKMVTFGVMLVIGLLLRFVMREWTILFRVLATGPNAEAEAQLDSSISKARIMAYFYWVGIAGTGFLGAVKPF